MEDTKAEIYELNYGTLLFRQIDRILQLSHREYADVDDKIFTFSWAVKMLRGVIAEKLYLKNDEFKEKEKELLEKRKEILSIKKYNFREDFDNIQDLFNLYINLLAKNGYLYKETRVGEYDE